MRVCAPAASSVLRGLPAGWAARLGAYALVHFFRLPLAAPCDHALHVAPCFVFSSVPSVTVWGGGQVARPGLFLGPCMHISSGREWNAARASRCPVTDPDVT